MSFGFQRALVVALSATFALAAVGCAEGNTPTDPCERALTRLVNDCNFQIEGLDELNLNCDGAAECVAKCLEESPCDDIAKGEGEFASCYSACQ